MDLKKQFEALSRSAYLDLVLPKNPYHDITALLRDTPDEPSRIPSRRTLFFDEEAHVLVTLKTPAPQEHVREILSHVEVVCSAHATDAVPQGAGNAASASGKHDICSRSFAGSTFTDVIALEDRTLIVWKCSLHLSRPRTKLQRPAIYFTSMLRISGSTRHEPRRNQSEFLQSYEPLSANVLEPLQFDPALSASHAFLPESRLKKIAPKAPNLQEIVKPIRGASKRAFPAVPALFSRVRYSTLPQAIIASLHLETSNVIAGTVTIDSVKLDVPGTQVEHLTNVSLPLKTRGGDETVMLCRVQELSGRTHRVPGEPLPVFISITASASLDQGSHITFSIDWQTHMELPQAALKSSYRWSRPISSLSGHPSAPSAQSNSRPVSFDAPQKPSEGENGITFSFTGPPTTYRDDDFTIQVHCNNRSARTRRFALVMLQPRKTNAPYQTHLQATKADADLLTNIFNAPTLSQARPLSALDKNADLRIGPLPAGACFESRLAFKALTTGVLDIGTLKIVDLDSRQTVDVKELPDVVALEVQSAE